MNTFSITQVFATAYAASQEEYTKQTGKPCPTFNPSLPVKRWYDLNPTPYPQFPDFVIYTTLSLTKDVVVVDHNGNCVLKSSLCSLAYAAAVNIPPTAKAGTILNYKEIPELKDWPLDFSKIPAGGVIRLDIFGKLFVQVEDSSGTTASDDQLTRIEKMIKAICDGMRITY